MSEKSFSVTPPGLEMNSLMDGSSTLIFDSGNLNLRPGPSEMAAGINLYFEFCHRQPIWCFERSDVRDFGTITDELACSILALTARFSQKVDDLQTYGNNARSLIMLAIANGVVGLTTIESLCLLSYSSFLGILTFFCPRIWLMN